MAEKNRTNDTLAMDGEIKSSQVKQRPPAPAPMVKAESVKVDPGKKSSKD